MPLFKILENKLIFIKKPMRKIFAKGFTLVELLIVIAIIAILAAVVFVALNPLKRFQDARDAQRWSNVTQLLAAVKIYQVDNKGKYPNTLTTLTDGNVYMIGTDTASCDSYNSKCTTGVSDGLACVDLSSFVTAGYLSSVPINPNGTGTWTAGHTGYTLQKNSNGTIGIRSCENEGSSTEIYLTH